MKQRGHFRDGHVVRLRIEERRNIILVENGDQDITMHVVQFPALLLQGPANLELVVFLIFAIQNRGVLGSYPEQQIPKVADLK